MLKSEALPGLCSKTAPIRLRAHALAGGRQRPRGSSGTSRRTARLPQPPFGEPLARTQTPRRAQPLSAAQLPIVGTLAAIKISALSENSGESLLVLIIRLK